MARTTVDIDPSVLGELKRRQQREGKTLGALISELLAAALAREDDEPEAFSWTTGAMTARVDLEDKDLVHDILDGS